jgi:hypothetical protein
VGIRAAPNCVNALHPFNESFVAIPRFHFALANSRDLSQTRSISGLQHRFIQFRRRMEGTAPEGDAPRAVIAMKFSTEAIVAAVVALVFAVLTLGAIAREQVAPANGLTTTPALDQVAALGFANSTSRPLLSGMGESRLLGQY